MGGYYEWSLSVVQTDVAVGGFSLWSRLRDCTKYLSVEAPAAIKEAFKQTTC